MTVGVRCTLGVGIGLALQAAPALAQDAAQGAIAFRKCSICHSAAPNGSSMIGPPLWGVVGRTAGTVPGFAYSAAMKKAGFPWTADRLDAFAAKPQAVVPGTRMPFAGMPDARERKDLVAYLKTLKK